MGLQGVSEALKERFKRLAWILRELRGLPGVSGVLQGVLGGLKGFTGGLGVPEDPRGY